MDIDISSSKQKTVIIDIDGVLAVEEFNKPYFLLNPVLQSQDALNTLKKAGFKIILHTSRFEFEKDSTLKWLKMNNFVFDEIYFNKPRGDLYIDDRGYRFNNWETFFNDVKIS